MKHKDETGQLLSKPGEVNESDQTIRESTTETSTNTIRPRSASLNAELPEGELEALHEELADRREEDEARGELRRIKKEDYAAIYAVLEYLKDDVRAFKAMKVKPQNHIGFALHRLARLLWEFE